MLRARKNRALMLGGVTLEDPATTLHRRRRDDRRRHDARSGRAPRGRDDDRRALPDSRRLPAHERDDRRRRHDPRSLGRSSSRRVERRRAHRAVRARAAGVGGRRERARRQLRRAEEDDARPRLEGQPSGVPRRRHDRRATSTSAPARSPATTTASTSTRRSSRTACSSAATRSWSRRCAIGKGAYVAAGSSITEGRARRTRWRSRAGGRKTSPAGPRARRAQARRRDSQLIHVRHRRIRRTKAAAARSSWRACEKLEYRGYDSAGVAVVRDGEMDDPPQRRQAVATSRTCSTKDPIDGEFGIGHTRWATHGRPTEENAHPHRDCHGRIVVVHNGIIENYLELKRELTAEGHTFVTETDTEIVAHLVEKEMPRRRPRGGGAARAEAAARAVRARADFRRRARTRSSRSATARRSSSASARTSTSSRRTFRRS